MNWPLFGLLKGVMRSAVVAAQWVGMSLLYLLILQGAPASECPNKMQLWGMLAVIEGLFLAVAVFTVPEKRPAWLPLRAVHYVLGFLAIVQFGVVPYAKKLDSIDALYFSFILVGFHKTFTLGFLMTHTRCRTDVVDAAQPIVSRAWPLGVILLVFLCPSTNWVEPTFLTYPFLVRPIDRSTYVAFTFVALFALDRISRDKECARMPDVLQWASLLLYLFHPVFIGVLVSGGIQQAGSVWIGCTLMSIVLSAGLVGVKRLKAR